MKAIIKKLLAMFQKEGVDKHKEQKKLHFTDNSYDCSEIFGKVAFPGDEKFGEVNYNEDEIKRKNEKETKKN